MTARRRPVLTVVQYQEGVRLFRAEVANIAWALVDGPSDITKPRRWRSLTPDQTVEVFDQLMRAVTRMASKDRARVVERLPDR